MSDGIFTQQAGAIPASAEELSQRYQKLFQQYSRLKAQHAVLKKAVIQEQASNVELQGNVKQKEKELRKLQEQLDLLGFHNERLTKRIHAVQDNEQKGSSFSLLGNSSIKKELEKSQQALDAANLDLEQKIDENERLHEELVERQKDFTDNINHLLKQIQDLEKKMADMQEESLVQSNVIKVNGTSDKSVEMKSEIEKLKNELKEKSKLLEESDRQAQASDTHLVSEIESLRAILLAKAGDLKNEIAEKQELKHVLPASDALKELEKQAKLYLSSTASSTHPPVLSLEIAEKLKISHQTWSNELAQLETQLSKQKEELETLLKEKQSLEKQHSDQTSSLEAQHQEHAEKIKKEIKQELEGHINEKEQKIAELLDTISTKDTANADLQKEHNDKVNELQYTIEQLSNGSDEVELLKKNHEENIAALQSTMEKVKAEHEEKMAVLQSTIQTEKETQTDGLKQTFEESMAQVKEEYETKVAILQSTIDELEKSNERTMDANSATKEEHEQKLAELQSTIDELKGDQDRLKALQDASVNLEQENTRLTDENTKLQKDIEDKTVEISGFLKEIEVLKEQNTLKESQDKETQIDKQEEEEDEEEKFVYPQPKEENIPKQIEEEEEEEEEVFVYRGRDAVIEEEKEENKENVPPPVSLVNENASASNESLSETNKNDTIELREAKLKAYYETQLNNMTEKLQIVDSKAVRFAEMYKSLKDKLISEEKDKQLMISEIERLNKELQRSQDLLATTESNYQQQVDAMTEYISSMQDQEAQNQQQRQSNRKGSYNQNYR
ncbi:hypothetical protein K501DRAFT_229050 [Backusella circina FSU 941]|nr:hypothetical protein K501DRAFT_229050 [Backusella circina FSU 941]